MCLLNHNFDDEYDMELSVWGEGTLTLIDSEGEDRLEEKFGYFSEEFGRYPRDISLFIEDCLAYGYDYGITGVETAFLERLETLKELILPDSITHIDMTPKLEEILRRNNTLIRGSFDSYAESFADEYGLNFRPSDFVFARYTLDHVQETTIMSLVFYRDGSVQVKEDISSTGSSAGNTFGGTFYYDVPRDFYRCMTAEQIAENFRSIMYDTTIQDGRLARFIETAKTHKLYFGKN